MRVLVIGESEKVALGKVKEYAEKNVLSFDDLLDIKNGTEPVVGDRKEHSCIIPQDFRVVYSVEKHPLKNGKGFAKIRHTSISVPEEGKLPNVQACEMIIMELGFKNPLQDCILSVEEGRAINIMEEME